MSRFTSTSPFCGACTGASASSLRFSCGSAVSWTTCIATYFAVRSTACTMCGMPACQTVQKSNQSRWADLHSFLGAWSHCNK